MTLIPKVHQVAYIYRFTESLHLRMCALTHACMFIRSQNLIEVA
jgi:hypothetical protein